MKLIFQFSGTIIFSLIQKARLLETTKEEGNQAFRNQDYAKALERYTTALAVDPLNTNTNAKLYNNRGTVNYKLNNKTECIEDCTKAINLDATYIKPYLRRAKWYVPYCYSKLCLYVNSMCECY